MIRKTFVMAVQPDKHEEYRRRHHPIFSELAGDEKFFGLLETIAHDKELGP